MRPRCLQRRFDLDCETGVVEVQDHVRERSEVIILGVLDRESQPDGRHELVRLGQQAFSRLLIAFSRMALCFTEDLKGLLDVRDPAGGEVLQHEASVVVTEELLEEVDERCLAAVVASHDERGLVIDPHVRLVQSAEIDHGGMDQLHRTPDIVPTPLTGRRTRAAVVSQSSI